MKKILFTMLGSLALLFTSGSVNAGSNNGYTTAANVYSGSSSRTWYGGGVQHALALWRMEADVAAKQEAAIKATEDAELVSPEEASSESAETTSTKSEVQPEAVAPSTEKEGKENEATENEKSAVSVEVKPEAVAPRTENEENAVSAEVQVEVTTEAIPEFPMPPTPPSIDE